MADAPGGNIEVEVVLALQHLQVSETLRVPAGATVGQALDQSGILLRYPEAASSSVAIGIFGRRAVTMQVLHEFDRVEIYQPLRVDPKQARRARQALKPQR